MQIKAINGVGAKVYCETLDNGLKVFMIPQKNATNIRTLFVTNYGSMHNEFIPNGSNEMVKVPDGIAHFLEHKVFEQETGEHAFNFYADKGADVNAWTSLYNTAYYFIGLDHLKENIDFLLDFVQSPYFTDENVNKEKGIIEAEIKMYDDDPYDYLAEKIRFNLLNKHPVRNPIIGTVPEIKALTKEDLYLCYNTFYHPSNMFVVAAGNFKVDEVLSIIKNNQASKDFKQMPKIITKDIVEEDKVFDAYEERKMSVQVPKLVYGIKIPIGKLKLDPKKRDLYLDILFNILFGETSLFYEKAKESGYLLSNVDINIAWAGEHILITLSLDSNNPDEIIAMIKETLANISITEEDLLYKKRKYISFCIYDYENISKASWRVLNDVIVYGKFYHNEVSIIKSLNIKELNRFIANLNLKNTSVLVINPLDK